MVAGHMESVENCSTLFHVLRWRAEHQPQRRAYTYLRDGEEDADDITYGELDLRARAIAAVVRQRAHPGDRALLLYPSGLEFIAAFIGCLYAGVIAVPAYQPNPRLERTLIRIRAITADARPAVVLTTASVLSKASHLAASDPVFREAAWLATDAEAGEAGSFRADARVDPGTLAFLQYTSGSTSTPRGVMVTHGNLMNNERVLQRVLGLSEDSVVVSWLPLFHDMGLIGVVLQALYTGFPCTLMSPAAFTQRPVRWLQAITRYRGSFSTAPDFAYAMCARQIDEADRGTLDLSSWTTAVNGAEPVRPDTLNDFADAFGPCGFSREALTPCYGLAEATLIVSGGPVLSRPVVLRAEEGPLRRGMVAVTEDEGKPLASSGQILPGYRAVIADPQTRVRCLAGQIGEIWLAGPSVTSGYWDSPASTEATFSARLAGTDEGPFLRTGDLGFIRDEQLFITSRLTDLIIIRGSNHTPQDIERTAENSHPALRPRSGIAFSIEDGGDARLVVVHEVRLDQLKVDCEEVATAVRRAVMEEHELDVYAVVLLKPGALPKTSSGKPQRRACRDQFLEGDLQQIGQSIRQLSAADVLSLALRVLQVDDIGIHQNFFDVGISSSQMVQIMNEIRKTFGREVSITEIFRLPTISSLAASLAGEDVPPGTLDRAAERAARRRESRGGKRRQVLSTQTLATGDTGSDIAVVGMACRFPGAASPGEFWCNLRGGVESITWLSERDMLDAGLQPAEASDERRVAAVSMPAGVADFDAGFFGISPREAMLMDPQHRLFLECAWEALEDAGHDPADDARATGVFAGSSMSTYLLYIVRPAGPSGTLSADLQLLLGNDKDYLATQVAYRFGLRGPALSVQTACSTSLVAVHLACQSLLGHECDLALAGGVTVRLPAGVGYMYEKRGVQSPDGHCRPFDVAAQGTVFGSGAGVVVLKRLADALADGDIVDAVIRGSAVNNDGSLKAGFTAPSEDGQADVVAEALGVAGVEPATIGYVEAHGTGTPIGDPIEVAALARAFRARAGAAGIPAASCALGAVKSNFGHLESAAGIAGLIKTVLALKHHEIPPTLHFTKPNPAIDFVGTPFHVSPRLIPWPDGRAPRRAGVSSFGMGGTNAHVIVEQAPAPRITERAPEPGAGAPHDRPYLLALSARNPGALAALARRYSEFFADGQPGECADLADVCWSAGARRAHHGHRGAVAGRDRKELRAALSAFATPADEGSSVTARHGRSRKMVFVFPGQGSQWVGTGSRLMACEPVFRAAVEQCDEAARRRVGCSPIAVLRHSHDGQPTPADVGAVQLALFAVQTGLAVWWRTMGINPDAVLGHGIGEVAAAHAAGVLSLDDATDVMGRLAGPEMTAAVRAAGSVGDTRPCPSAIEFISAAAGEPVDVARLDRSYWGESPRDPVRFTDSVRWLAEHGHEVFVEISPDQSLLPAIETSLLQLKRPGTTIASLRRDTDEQRALLDGLAALYGVGRTIDWDRLYPHHAFVRLPIYPWQRQRCWVDTPQEPRSPG